MAPRKNLTLSLSMEQYVTLIAEAEKAGLSLSEYARRRIFGRRVSPRIPLSDTAAIAKMNQVAGLIKQLWKAETVDPGETKRLLNDANEIMRLIRTGLAEKASSLQDSHDDEP